VREEGLEPTQDFSYQILSLARLPIPPLAQKIRQNYLYVKDNKNFYIQPPFKSLKK
jgi:hypothetical protein